MKKLFILPALALTALFAVHTAYAVEPHDLIFTPDTSGKYIYCNNHEFIRRSDLADFSNQQAKFIMNNENLTADKYALFVSHVNHTERRNSANTIIDAGFDIELDAAFIASEDTVIRLDAVGFEVPENKRYRYNGKLYTYEDEWGCFHAWASYMQLPIRQIDSGQLYEPTAFEPIEFEVKAGQTRWLSEFIPNYCVDPWFRPVHIMADFEILSGECDVNIAALKSTGTVGDRSFYNPASAFGSFERDRQYKGVAESLNRVNASLSYTIDDNLWSGTALPVRVYNQSVPEGNEITKWYTHLNPRADQWSDKLCTESDMLEFKYYDPNKKNYYGKNAGETDDYWYFDTRHNDTAEYKKEYGGSASGYAPNRLLEGSGTDAAACNLGNYGVILHYDIDITNDGNLIRYATYRLSTGSNNIVILRDANGNPIDPYALCKGTRDARVMDGMACVELPAHKTTKFSVEVILTTNYSGGMENSLFITDTPDVVEVYESPKQEISTPYPNTGREFYKWENASLYISDDLENWRAVGLDSRIRTAVKGNWEEFELLYTGNGYMLKPCLYDGIPYYTVQDFFKTVYFLDDNFRYVSEHKFDYYPSDYAIANGVYYVKAATPYISTNAKKWEYWPSPLPTWNYGRFSALSAADGVRLSTDGESFDKVVYEDFNPGYIDSITDLYYFAYGNTLYTSSDGVYWSRHEMSNKIKSLYKIGDKLIVNGSETIDADENRNSVVIKLNGEYIGFSKPPIFENGVTLVPARFMSEYLGADVEWHEGVITISKDEINTVFMPGSETAFVNGERFSLGAKVTLEEEKAYVPLRFLAERFGMTVEWDSEHNIATVK